MQWKILQKVQTWLRGDIQWRGERGGKLSPKVATPFILRPY